MLISDLLKTVRFSLADNSERYELPQLVDATNQAVAHFQRDIDYFISRAVISLNAEQTPLFRGFNIGDSATKIIRVEYSGTGNRGRKAVPFIGAEQLDQRYRNWRESKSTVIDRIVVNNQNECEFLVYPQLVVEAQNEGDLFGVVVNFDEPGVTIIGDDGVVADSLENYLYIVYAARQPLFDVTIVNDEQIIIKRGDETNTPAELPIRDDIGFILQHLVVYMVLSTTQEQSSFALADRHLQLYNSKLQQLKESKQSNYVDEGEIIVPIDPGVGFDNGSNNYGNNSYYNTYFNGDY